VSDDVRDLDAIASLFHVSEAAVRNWVKAGLPTVATGSRGGARKRTRISLAAATSWYFTRNREQLKLGRARTRLAQTQAERLRHENDLTSADLGSRDTWRRAEAAFLSWIRKELAAFPASAVRRLGGDLNHNEDILDRAVAELLEQIDHYQGKQ
jgi:phage terminase Nu1 subunit (DNA packaging protein)